MPFSSLSDPAVLARALSASDAAWERVKDEQIFMLGSEEAERTRLKFIVGSLAPLALSEEELVERAIEHFRQKASHEGASTHLHSDSVV
ncbi:MAG TPA: hypothetical protein VGO06_13565 [Bosea sp. (in: a-proteobacteria)]|jgi:hypothetical protein|nr:hypothetical protein [Bosea sp. (in: a-proteobacteria)]